MSALEPACRRRAVLAALEELLADQLRVLGPDNPHTLITRANIAHWQKQLSNGTPA